MSEVFVSTPLVSPIACPECDGLMRRSREESTFPYTCDGRDILVTAELSTWSCEGCGTRFLDGEAEDEKHAAICRHLGLLTPAEITELREQLQMGVSELAALTGFGAASIKRWEAGTTIQNRSSDNLLRLMRFPKNIGRLEASRAVPSSRTGILIEGKFRTRIEPGVQERAAGFRLRKGAG